MLYLANPSTTRVRDAMVIGPVGAIMSPRQGNRLPADAMFAIDNNCGPGKDGRPGTAYPGDERYMTLIQALIEADGADPYDPFTSRCLFATAPNVVGDAQATLRRSYMLGWIRYAGLPAALVAQDGLEHLATPLGRLRCLVPRRQHGLEARPGRPRPGRRGESRGKWVHMGRVNSLKRLRYADAIGCDSADGTFLTYAPDANLPRLLGWLRQVNDQAPLWEAA